MEVLGSNKQAMSRLADCFLLNIECFICSEVKELRQLPCQHMMCYECLESIIKVSTDRGLNPRCCYCKDEITREAEDYPICRLASNLQHDIKQLRQALEAEANAICQTESCNRPVDFYCSQCKITLCFRCSRKECASTEDGTHDLIGYEDQLEACRTEYNRWKKGKEEEKRELANMKVSLVTKLKSEVANISPENLSEIIDYLTSMKTEIQSLYRRAAEVDTLLAQFDIDVKRIPEPELIRLVEELDVAPVNNETIEQSQSCKTVVYPEVRLVPRSDSGLSEPPSVPRRHSHDTKHLEKEYVPVPGRRRLTEADLPSTEQVNQPAFEVNLNQPLQDQCWYHSELTIQKCEGLLANQADGTFLVRVSTSNRDQHTLTVKTESQIINLKIVKQNGRYSIGQYSLQTFENIPSIIKHCRDNPFHTKGGRTLVLKTPLPCLDDHYITILPSSS